ncbi:MAG: hypothetical protein O8C67_14665 [Candidatus Methanoperedens sp.]|nr:hypothetical protein [Candidatus Methanoperedens sp.]
MIVKKGSFVIEGLENVQINIGKIGEGLEEKIEGPTPRPEIISLRNWDYRTICAITARTGNAT